MGRKLFTKAALLGGLLQLTCAGIAAEAPTTPVTPPAPVHRVLPQPAVRYEFGDPVILAPAVQAGEPALSKISSLLRDVRDRAASQEAGPSVMALNNDFLRVRGDKGVHVALICWALDENRKEQLREAGFEYEAEALMPQVLAEGWLRPANFDAVQALDFVRYIRPAGYPVVSSGAVTAQSDDLMRSAQVRSTIGYDGKGVRVGVISDSCDQRAASQATGDLPPDSRIYIGKDRTAGDEGTAMMEIIHDMAPGANFGFYAPTTEVEMAGAVTNLREAGCRVIVDDLTWPDQPWFEAGIIEESISANTAAGVTYLTAAGNFAQTIHATTFSPITATISGNSWTVHDYTQLSAGSKRYLMPVRVGPSATLTVLLQWDSKWGSPADDYNIYVTDDQGLTVYAKADTVQGTLPGNNPNPVEIVQLKNQSTWDAWAFVCVRRVSGANRNVKMWVFGASIDALYRRGAGTIVADDKAQDALTVAAIDAADSGLDTIENFSSQGPVTLTWPTPVTLSKPDITGLDGIAVTGAGGFAKTFYGTSAAAPTVASVAAIILSANNFLTPTQVKAVLTSTALERGAAGPDNAFGAGLCDALAALSVVEPGTRLAVQTQVAQASPGLPFSVQPVVRAVDKDGNTVTTFTGAVTVAVVPGNGTPGAVLNGTKTVTAVDGVASFTDLAIDKAGFLYKLEASAPDLGLPASVESALFNVAYPPGDVTLNGQFDLTDVTLSLRVWAGLDTFPL